MEPSTTNNVKLLKQKNILSFGFKTVSADMHRANIRREIIMDREKSKKELEHKLFMANQKEERAVKRAKQIRAERISSQKAIDESLQEQKEVDEINRATAEQVLAMEEVLEIFDNIDALADIDVAPNLCKCLLRSNGLGVQNRYYCSTLSRVWF